MCGICGEIGTVHATDTAAVEAMSDVMVPRGPDGHGTYTKDHVVFGHRRLAIIDLSEAGAQPMHDADLRLSIVFNGCIYNYPELLEELRGLGHTFRGHSDTEVILKAYAQWG